MKDRKNDKDPVIKKSELDKVRKDISNYFSNEYPDWLLDTVKDEIQAIVKNAIVTKPKWFLDIVSEIVKDEIRKNLKIDISGYDTIYIDLKYKGNKFTETHKYHPRG